MDSKMALLNVCLLIFFVLSNAKGDARRGGRTKIFNVMRYGAVANGKIDNSKAFVRAWQDACGWREKSRVLIPSGTYMVNSAFFLGPCKGPIAFIVKGMIMAPILPSLFFTDHWIHFRYIDRLTITGGGSFHGQGAHAWRYGGCAANPHCKTLPVSVRLDFVTNSKIHHLSSIDSKNFHFNLAGCQNLTMSEITITAPATSPNTDGIHIGISKNISITRSVIQTGDDCISILGGSHGIHISQITCGPGHGISVGSLGSSPQEENVSGIIVTNCTLRGTQNGLRIKTRAPSSRNLASDFVFENIFMENVHNPIFIDQHYCPYSSCTQAQSQVQIRNVTYKDIKGTSSSKEAIQLKCSRLVPCKSIKLVDINLAYKGRGGPATSVCSNAGGKSYGHQSPIGCL